MTGEFSERDLTHVVARPMDFYQRLRARMKEWLRDKVGRHHKYAEYLLFAPDFFHLLVKLVGDKRIPSAEKGKLLGAIAYFVSPLDFIAEAIMGPIGYIDDLVISAYVLNSLITKSGKEIVREHWAGDGDVIAIIEKVLAKADELVGSGVWKRLKRPPSQ